MNCAVLSRWSMVLGLWTAFGFAEQPGHTEILKWPDGKKGAVSLTYDDGSINQFRVAVPIMNRLGFPATFHIITGNIAGSTYHGTFLGRPTDAIIQESATIPTNKDNFFERASAIGYLGYQGTLKFHTQAGELYDAQDKPIEAYRLLDDAYAKVRQGAFPRSAKPDATEDPGGIVTWDDLAALAKQGHEISSHTITHAKLAVLDDVNLAYELEKSQQEIRDHLGVKHTFTIECPYGTENERVVTKAQAIYPAARYKMPDEFLEVLNRATTADPAAASREYVQWQRGPLSKTPMALMKSWIDVTASHDNIWLVLVFHGVDGIGWEAKTSAELKEYFDYLKGKEDRLWVATFQDVAKYVRERKHGSVETSWLNGTLRVTVHHDLKDARYDLPLSLKTVVPTQWSNVEIRQGDRLVKASVTRHGEETSVTYSAQPNAEPVFIGSPKTQASVSSSQ